MILTYHQAIELMSYLPMALPVLTSQTDDQSELAHLHQDRSDLQTLALEAGATDNEEQEIFYTRKTA